MPNRPRCFYRKTLELLACAFGPFTNAAVAEAIQLKVFEPKLGLLSGAQRELWPQFIFSQGQFVLYDGTALALRLGHRVSEDFDFFSFQPLDAPQFYSQNALLVGTEILQMETNTLSCLLPTKAGTVKISFFGGLTFGQVEEAEFTRDETLRVASLPDLFATKLNTIYQRAEIKDYLDVYAILQAGFSLQRGLDFARQVYGEAWNAMLPLQALCYFEEPTLRKLAPEIRQSLVAAVQSVN